MLMPSIFGENLFDDDWMDFPFKDEFWGKKNPLYGKHAQNMMKTDIRETDGSYELDVAEDISCLHISSRFKIFTSQFEGFMLRF